jgi:protein TonB
MQVTFVQVGRHHATAVQTPRVAQARAAATQPTPRHENASSSDATTTEDTYVEARADVATINNPKPPYPLAARRLGLQGRVLLSALVQADGSCREVRVKTTSGHQQLDDAALHAVRRWRFIPASRGARPVDAWVDVPINFQLNG